MNDKILFFFFYFLFVHDLADFILLKKINHLCQQVLCFFLFFSFFRTSSDKMINKIYFVVSPQYINKVPESNENNHFEHVLFGWITESAFNVTLLNNQQLYYYIFLRTKNCAMCNKYPKKFIFISNYNITKSNTILSDKQIPKLFFFFCFLLLRLLLLLGRDSHDIFTILVIWWSQNN